MAAPRSEAEHVSAVEQVEAPFPLLEFGSVSRFLSVLGVVLYVASGVTGVMSDRPPGPSGISSVSPYYVFFAPGGASMAEGQAPILDRAAQAFPASGAAEIRVEAHTDTSQDEKQSLTVSQQRAAVVRAELVKRGISSSLIYTRALGSSQPLIATGPGVREPQNNRVVITFVMSRPSAR